MKKTVNKTTRRLSMALFTALLIALSCIGIASAQDSGLPSAPALIAVSKYEPYPAEPGKYVDVWLKVINYANIDMKNLVFKLTPRYPFTLYESDSPERTFGTVISGEQAMMKFKVKVDENAVEGMNPLDFEYTYSARGSPQTGQVEVDVRTIHPDIAVTSITVTPDKIEPNKPSDVLITLKNTGESALQDVILTLDVSSSDSPFIPINSINEKRISVINGGEEKQAEFQLAALSNAEAKIYKVPLAVSYTDKTGNSYTKQTYIGLMVGSKPDIVVLMDQSAIVKRGAPGKVTFKVVNKGLTGIKLLYLTVKPTADFDVISSENVYVGKIDNDDYETADYTLLVKKTKDDIAQLPIHLEYKDANNNDYSQDLTVELNLKKSKMNNNTNGSGAGLVIAIIVIVGGYLIYRRWKKKKTQKHQ